MQTTEMEQNWRDIARDFAKRKLEPATEWLEGEEFWKNARKLADHGFLGLTLPEEYGGMNLSIFDACLIIEELCLSCKYGDSFIY
jgi:alkylation response protein AidB-like acyl-CoA dehydrogenase